MIKMRVSIEKIMSANKAVPAKISTTDRVMKGECHPVTGHWARQGTSQYFEADVPHPATKKLSVSEVIDGDTGKPLADVVMKHFVREGRLEEEAALVILTEATALLRAEDTMIDVEAPITGLPPKVLRVYCMFFLEIGDFG